MVVKVWRESVYLHSQRRRVLVAPAAEEDELAFVRLEERLGVLARLGRAAHVVLGAACLVGARLERLVQRAQLLAAPLRLLPPQQLGVRHGGGAAELRVLAHAPCARLQRQALGERSRGVERLGREQRVGDERRGEGRRGGCVGGRQIFQRLLECYRVGNKLSEGAPRLREPRDVRHRRGRADGWTVCAESGDRRVDA